LSKSGCTDQVAITIVEQASGLLRENGKGMSLIVPSAFYIVSIARSRSNHASCASPIYRRVP